MDEQAILLAKKLNKQYLSHNNKQTVINDLELEVKPGEFIIIMGNSGSGKSTLLYLLSGLDEVNEGEILFKGQPIQQKNESEWAFFRRKYMGFIFQQAHLVPNLTVMENILVAGYLSGENKKTVRARANELLELTGLGDLGRRLPAQLSGGQQQRAALVRALIHTPAILLADEPTGNLNSSSSETVMNLLADFHQRGQTILLVTHELKAACRGDKVLYLRDGKIIDELKFDPSKPSQAQKETSLVNWLSLKGW